MDQLYSMIYLNNMFSIYADQIIGVLYILFMWNILYYLN